MNRPPIVAFALLAAVLVATAPPAAATNVSGSLSVATKTTTDSEFSSAQELTNLTVEGSGVSANVSLSSGGSSMVVQDDFEDGDMKEYGGDTARFQTTSGPNAINGTSAERTGGSGDAIIVDDGLSDPLDDGQRARLTINLTGDNIAGLVFFAQAESGSASINGYSLVANAKDNKFGFNKFSNGNGNPLQKTNVGISQQKYYLEVEVSGSSLTGRLFETDGTKVAQVSDSDGQYRGDGMGLQAVELNPGASTFDDLRVNGSAGNPSSARYVSRNVSADNVRRIFTNLTLTNTDATVKWQAYNGSGFQTVGDKTYSSSGNRTLAANNIVCTTVAGCPISGTQRVVVEFTNIGSNPTAKVHDHGTLFESAAPSGGNPSPIGNLSSYGGSISLQVNDSDFGLAQGDNVTVTATNADTNSQIGQTSIQSNQTVSFSYSATTGQNNITWALSDDYGDSVTVDQSFTAPGNATVFNETQPTQKVQVDVNGTFFAGDTIIINQTNTATIDLDDLPLDRAIILSINADGYHQRPFLIEQISQDQRVYALSKNVSSVEVRFTLEDRTGDFDPADSRLEIQKPITRDYDGDNDNETQWEAVAGDAFGVAGVTVDLEEGQRYRLIVRNADGDSRIVGTYVADVSETRPIQLGQVKAVPPDDTTRILQSAAFSNTSGPVVSYQLNDTENLTSEVQVAIHERNNQSNELLNQTISGPLGTTAVSQPIPANQSDKTWVVEATVTRDGQTVQFRRIVGPRVPLLPSLPGWAKAIISIGSIWVVAGLFSQLNGDVGAVATATLGGLFFFTGFLPGSAGVGIVILAFVLAGIMLLRDRGGGGL